MTSSKYLFVNNFLPHVFDIPERASAVGISELIFEDGLHPNNYRLRYFLRNKSTGVELQSTYRTIKLDPMVPSRSNVRMLEYIPVGIGYDLVIQFEPLEGAQKPDRIAVRVEYQVYL